MTLNLDEIEARLKAFSGNETKYEFIAHTRTDIPNLIQAVRELAEALRWYANGRLWCDEYGDDKECAKEVLEKWGLK